MAHEHDWQIVTTDGRACLRDTQTGQLVIRKHCKTCRAWMQEPAVPEAMTAPKQPTGKA